MEVNVNPKQFKIKSEMITPDLFLYIYTFSKEILWTFVIHMHINKYCHVGVWGYLRALPTIFVSGLVKIQ